jgi:hypothetical protein
MDEPLLVTTNAVIDAIGGTAAAAWLTRRGQSAASNWRQASRFPPNTYLAMNSALAAKGLYAPAWLWGMVEARPPASETKADAKSGSLPKRTAEWLAEDGSGKKQRKADATEAA